MERRGEVEREGEGRVRELRSGEGKSQERREDSLSHAGTPTPDFFLAQRRLHPGQQGSSGSEDRMGTRPASSGPLGNNISSGQ